MNSDAIPVVIIVSESYKNPSELKFPLVNPDLVELGRRYGAKTMRWMPRIRDMENGAVAQIVRNNSVAAGMVDQRLTWR